MRILIVVLFSIAIAGCGSNTAKCGALGTVCCGNNTCSGGACVGGVCQVCGARRACGSSDLGCSDNVCKVCGGAGQACCPGGACSASGSCCDLGSNTCVALVGGVCPMTCGGTGQACCPGATPCTAPLM